MDLAGYRQLRAQALRLSRRADEAEDLLQDTLLAALEAGRNEPAWLAAVLRKQAALAARTAMRRRKREELAAADTETVQQATATGSTGGAGARTWLQQLPPAARQVAVLALHGLSADEIRWILRLPAAAFRQRLTSIRRRLGELPPELRAESLASAYVRDPARSADLQFGLVRRALKAAMRVGEGLGTHDADGHLILIDARAHTSGPRGNR